MTGHAGHRWVLHMDMDAFFVSVEQLTRPTLRERAVLVGGMGPRGTVAGAGYPAREYGAHSAMPMAEARRRCPIAIVLPPRFRLYQEVSRRVFAIVRELTTLLEQVSIDETFFEPEALAGAGVDDVIDFAARLRARIQREVGVPASIGAGSGKQIAKISSGLAKPDGLRVIPPEQERALLTPLPVRKLWGIGPVTESKLHRIGVRTIGQFAELNPGDVVSLLGHAHGTELHRLAHGLDEHPITERGESKQVSAETTFDTDLHEPSALAAEITEMAGSAHRRLVAARRAARTITVKMRDSTFTTISRSESLPAATSDLSDLVAAARRLSAAAVAPGTAIRLVGVSYSGLAAFEQEPLFGADGQEADERTTTQARATPPGGRNATVSPAALWRAGDDVHHPRWGHGWVQGAGHGRVTVRFETTTTGRGKAHTFACDDADLHPADPLTSLS